MVLARRIDRTTLALRSKRHWPCRAKAQTFARRAGILERNSNNGFIKMLSVTLGSFGQIDSRHAKMYRVTPALRPGTDAECRVG
jgi:hypothetical protein